MIVVYVSGMQTVCVRRDIEGDPDACLSIITILKGIEASKYLGKEQEKL